jgi:hypothetical protein
MKEQKQDIKELLSSLVGNQNTISVNTLFIDFTGSHEGALLLSQLWYWSSRTQNDGWIAKTYAEWFDEIRVREDSARRIFKKFESMGFLETALKKFAGNPTRHYRVNLDKLIELLGKFCQETKPAKCQIGYQQNAGNETSKIQETKPAKCKHPYTETTTETTTEITNKEKEKINKKEKPTTEIEAVPTEIDDLLSFYNQLFQKSVRSTKGFEQNYWHWRQFHTIGKIEQALVNARKDKFWRDKMTLTILFRKKNQNGESVDYIEDLSSRVTVKQGQVVAI